MQPGDPRPAHTNERATNALHSAWKNRGWNQRTVGRVHWQVDSALAHRRDTQTPIAVSEHPVPDRHPIRHAVSEEGTGAPDWRTPKERRATDIRSISRYPPNDEREQAHPFTPDRRPYLTRSISGKKYEISTLAFSGESDPCTALNSMFVPWALRIVPGSALAGSVAPISSRFFLMALSPCNTITSDGPEHINSQRLSKNGLALCTA